VISMANECFKGMAATLKILEVSLTRYRSTIDATDGYRVPVPDSGTAFLGVITPHKGGFNDPDLEGIDLSLAADLNVRADQSVTIENSDIIEDGDGVQYRVIRMNDYTEEYICIMERL